MLNTVNLLTFTADKKPVSPQKIEQPSLLKIYNPGDKAVLSTNNEKKPEVQKKNFLPPFQKVALSAFGLITLCFAGTLIYKKVLPAEFKEVISNKIKNVKEFLHKINPFKKVSVKEVMKAEPPANADNIAKEKVTQLVEELENVTKNPANSVKESLKTFVDESLTVIDDKAKKVSLAVQQAVELNPDRTLKTTINPTNVAKVKQAQAELKEITSSVSEPIIDIADKIADKAKDKLTGEKLQTALEDLKAKADHPTDLIVRIEEGFNRTFDDVANISVPDKKGAKLADEALNTAVKELHIAGEPEKAKLLAEQYEGIVERANPAIVEEKRELTAKATEIKNKLKQANSKATAVEQIKPNLVVLKPISAETDQIAKITEQIKPKVVVSSPIPADTGRIAKIAAKVQASIKEMDPEFKEFDLEELFLKAAKTDKDYHLANAYYDEAIKAFEEKNIGAGEIFKNTYENLLEGLKK